MFINKGFLVIQMRHPVYAINKDNTQNCQARVKVTPKVINFRRDTGADVTAVPDWYFRKNSPLGQQTKDCTELVITK